MSWAANRETAIEEGQAYSLLGVFNIYLPPICGEGAENAFIRFRGEIKKHSGVDSGNPF